MFPHGRRTLSSPTDLAAIRGELELPFGRIRY
jgi:hypothetical protein